MKVFYYAIDFYDRKVVEKIIDKYNLEPMEAVKQFLTSETHKMLEDPECGLMAFPDRALFDMWEVEQITGDPRNSSYIRAE